MEDGGLYQCRVEQFHLQNEGQWQLKASESAGPVMVTVVLPGNSGLECSAIISAQKSIKISVSIIQRFVSGKINPFF